MVVKPVYFAVITTIMMFVPMMLLSGPIRTMFEQISLVVIAVLIFSLIEAFFILPAHLRKLKPIDPSEVKGIMKFQHALAESLNTFARTFFRPLIASLIKFRYITFSVFFAQGAIDRPNGALPARPLLFLPAQCFAVKIELRIINMFW